MLRNEKKFLEFVRHVTGLSVRLTVEHSGVATPICGLITPLDYG